MDVHVTTLVSKAKKIFHSDLNLAIETCLEAVNFSREKEMPYETAYALVYYATFLSEKTNDFIILEHILEAISIAKNIENDSLLLLCLIKRGRIYLRLGDLDKSLNAYRVALDAGLAYKNEEDLSEIYFGIGTIFSYKENDQESLFYFEKGREIAKKFNNLYVEVKILNNTGCSYHYLGDLDKAEKYLNECTVLCREHNYFNILINALDELGLICKKRGRGNPVEIWNEALTYSRKRGQTIYSVGPLLNLATYYYEKKEWKEADKYLQKAKEVSEKAGSKTDQVEIYKLETRLYESRGDFKSALNSNKMYSKLWNEIQNQESVRDLKKKELELLTETRDKILSLSKVGRLITSTLDLETVLSRSFINLKEIFNFSILGIAQYNEKTGEILFELSIEEQKIQPKYKTTIDTPNSLAAWAIRNDQKIIISDFEKQSFQFIPPGSKFVSIPSDSKKNPRSVIYNPLKIGDHIIGVITIQSYDLDAFTKSDTDSFDIFSSYVAIALNNALQTEKIKAQNTELSKLATTDSLTGLHNRRAFFKTLNQFSSLAKRNGFPISFIMIDVDFFKKINDRYGHPAGDYILKEIAGILLSFAKREYDDSARLGGEEFGIFLGDTDSTGAVSIAEEIRKSIEEYDFSFDNASIPVTASLGVVTRSIWDDYTFDPGRLINEADKRLYMAKNSGRNCVMSIELA
ncbi:MAG: diguanylate cyclase [Spirochaetales bacterium]|nr:diguanylate cyclase [Spirochaetales bacterium]